MGQQGGTMRLRTAYVCFSASWCGWGFVVCKIKKASLVLIPVSHKKCEKVCYLFLAIMKYNILKISFGEFV